MATNEFSKNDAILKIQNNPKTEHYALLAQLQSAISAWVMGAFQLYKHAYHHIVYILKGCPRGNGNKCVLRKACNLVGRLFLIS